MDQAAFLKLANEYKKLKDSQSDDDAESREEIPADKVVETSSDPSESIDSPSGSIMQQLLTRGVLNQATPAVDQTPAVQQQTSASDTTPESSPLDETPQPMSEDEEVPSGSPMPEGPAVSGAIGAAEAEETPESTETPEGAAQGATIGAPAEGEESSEEETPEEPAKKGLTIEAGTGSINTIQNLQDAQNAATATELVNNLGRASELISTGIGHYITVPIAQKLFEENAKQAQNIVNDYLQRAAQEQNDPNSPISQAFKQYIAKFGVNLQGDISAAQGEKLLPSIYRSFELEQQRQQHTEDLTAAAKAHTEDIAERIQGRHEDVAAQIAGRSADRAMMADAINNKIAAAQQSKDKAASDKLTHDMQEKYLKFGESLNKDIGGRGASAGPHKLIQASQKIQDLAAMYPNLNGVPINLVPEFVAAYNTLLTGGQGTDTKFKHTLPDNFKGTMAQAISWITGGATPAQQGPILQTLVDSAKRNEVLGAAQEKEIKVQHLIPYQNQIDPKDLENFMAKHQITPDELNNYTPGSIIHKTLNTVQMPTNGIVKVRQKSTGAVKNKTPDEAQKILADPTNGSNYEIVQ